MVDDRLVCRGEIGVTDDAPPRFVFKIVELNAQRRDGVDHVRYRSDDELRLDRRRLSGAQKAAVLLIVLGKEGAPRVLQHLSKEAVLRYRARGRDARIVDRTALDGMVDEFSERFRRRTGIVGTLSRKQKARRGNSCAAGSRRNAPSTAQNAPSDRFGGNWT